MSTTIIRYPAGQVLFSEGDPSDEAFFILSGQVEVTQRHADGEVVLARLGGGQIVGEMAVVECRPRSATVTATEDTEVRRFERDEIDDLLRSDPEMVLRLLATLAERLRVANARIPAGSDLLLETSRSLPMVSLTAEPQGPPTLTLRPQTRPAQQALGGDELTVREFPFHVGRVTDDPLVVNHWAIRDPEPHQISRAHLLLVVQDDQLAAYDRGSFLGSAVAGQRLGGSGGRGPVFLPRGNSALVLGNEDSPYRFEATVS